MREPSGPCLVMRRQHVLTYSQQSERVCVCLQPNREQISEEPLNGTYKLIAKWLKSLDCYLSVSLQEALCHSSMRPVSLLPTNHLVPVAIQTATAVSHRETRVVYWINTTSLFRCLWYMSGVKAAAG